MSRLTRSYATPLNVSATDTGNSPILPSLQESDLYPGPYSVSFSTSPSVAGEAVSTWAYINWKVEGQQRQRIISVANGAIISGVCDGIGVQVQDVTSIAGEGSTDWNPLTTYSAGQVAAYNGIMWYSLTNGNTGNIPTNTPQEWAADTYTVFAQMAPGVRPTTGQPPILITLPPFQVHGRGGNVVVPIPQDAGVLSALILVAAPPALGTVTLTDITAEQTGVSGSIAPTYYPLINNQWITIYPGSTNLNIVNENASNLVNVTVIWGIEG